MNWYLKRNDGEVYGPVDLPTLQLWAMDGRVAPDDKISADLEKWAPVSDLAELSMKWNVELRDGSTYGPIHLLALRDLIYEGSVSRRAKIKHKQSGEEAVAGEALLFELIETESKAPSTIVALTDRLGDAEKRIEKLQQELQNAAWIEDKLRDEVKILTAKQKGIQPAADAPSAQVHQDLQEQVDKWRKLYEEAHATAAEAELKHQVREPKSGDDPHNTFAQEEVEKWKKLHEGAVAQIEQLKNRQAAVQPAGDDTVPRARIEEAERKLAQTERNYQQLLKTLNRSFGARTPGRPVPQADNLQRRDIN